MKPGTIQLGNASLHLGYSQITKPNQRGLLREITAFHVPEEFRGKGEGTALLMEVCNRADQERMHLLLMADTPRLKEFYQRFGFNPISLNDDILLVRVPNSQ
jgi:ribosomal protein S18 acetylase RimI-like enzyme